MQRISLQSHRPSLDLNSYIVKDQDFISVVHGQLTKISELNQMWSRIHKKYQYLATVRLTVPQIYSLLKCEIIFSETQILET